MLYMPDDHHDNAADQVEMNREACRRTLIPKPVISNGD
jgi:hypothetical protein